MDDDSMMPEHVPDLREILPSFVPGAAPLDGAEHRPLPERLRLAADDYRFDRPGLDDIRDLLLEASQELDRIERRTRRAKRMGQRS